MSPRRRIIPIFVPHAGCPNDCVFCNQRRISGSLFPASGDTVRAALSGIEDGAGIELAFYGGSFTAIPAQQQEELLAAAAAYRARGVVGAIRVSTRPDCVDAASLERLRAYGVTTVELGAQSMSDRVLALSGRGHTAADTRRGAKLVKDAGFFLILQMMTGLPGSDDETDVETARQLADLRPGGVRIYPTVIVRDTALETMWRAGLYREHTVEDAVRVCAQIVPIFEAADIPVIRLGLNPTEELSGGAALGGAYHPALGELVRSRILRSKAEALLCGVPPGSRAALLVPPRWVSAMTGRHRENLAWLKNAFSLSELRVRPDETTGEGIKLQILP